MPSVASDHLRGGSTGSSIWTRNGEVEFLFQMSENHVHLDVKRLDLLIGAGSGPFRAK